MSFTDDQLKRLKDIAKELGTNIPWQVPLTTKEALGLIGRLEAAEAFINQLQKEHLGDSDMDEDKRLHDAWQKAAGK